MAERVAKSVIAQAREMLAQTPPDVGAQTVTAKPVIHQVLEKQQITITPYGNVVTPAGTVIVFGKIPMPIGIARDLGLDIHIPLPEFKPAETPLAPRLLDEPLIKPGMDDKPLGT